MEELRNALQNGLRIFINMIKEYREYNEFVLIKHICPRVSAFEDIKHFLALSVHHYFVFKRRFANNLEKYKKTVFGFWTIAVQFVSVYKFTYIKQLMLEYIPLEELNNIGDRVKLYALLVN